MECVITKGINITNPTLFFQIDTQSVSGGQCTSSGDPHVRTFDNAFFNHYYIGDYTLVQSRARNFTVNTIIMKYCQLVNTYNTICLYCLWQKQNIKLVI